MNYAAAEQPEPEGDADVEEIPATPEPPQRTASRPDPARYDDVLAEAVANLELPDSEDAAGNTNRIVDLITAGHMLEERDGSDNVMFNALCSEISDNLAAGIEAENPHIMTYWGENSSRTFIIRLIRSLASNAVFQYRNVSVRDPETNRMRRRRVFGLNREHPLIGIALAVPLGTALRIPGGEWHRFERRPGYAGVGRARFSRGRLRPVSGRRRSRSAVVLVPGVADTAVPGVGKISDGYVQQRPDAQTIAARFTHDDGGNLRFIRRGQHNRQARRVNRHQDAGSGLAKQGCVPSCRYAFSERFGRGEPYGAAAANPGIPQNARPRPAQRRIPRPSNRALTGQPRRQSSAGKVPEPAAPATG